MSLRALILCAVPLLFPSVVRADDKPPEKPKVGLKAGNDLPGPFRPFNVTGKYEKKFHCLSDEHGLNPGVMVIVQNMKIDGNDDAFKPVLALLKGLDQYIVERPQSRLNAFAVFLFSDLTDVVKDNDSRIKHIDELTKINGGDNALKHVILSLDSAAALRAAGYEIDPEWRVAVVLYDQLQVKKGVEVYAFKGDMTKDKVDAILKEVKENLAPYKK